MNEFLLLAVVIIYLAISYVPGHWQGQRDERSSHHTAETDGQ
jgi:thiosulfate reductase cytochrome b subunit